jgi:hypothetical protein
VPDVEPLPIMFCNCRDVLFSFWRRFFSPALHKWQNSHANPLLHPGTFQKNAHGLQLKLLLWPIDPIVGHEGVPTSGGKLLE